LFTARRDFGGEHRLGRRPILPEPDAYCSELEHSEEARSELVITRGQASEIFDFIEEALNQVTVLVKRLAETVSLRAV